MQKMAFLLYRKIENSRSAQLWRLDKNATNQQKKQNQVQTFVFVCLLFHSSSMTRMETGGKVDYEIM